MKIKILAKINETFHSFFPSSGAPGALEPDRGHQNVFFFKSPKSLDHLFIFSIKHCHHYC